MSPPKTFPSLRPSIRSAFSSFSFASAVLLFAMLLCSGKAYSQERPQDEKIYIPDRFSKQTLIPPESRVIEKGRGQKSVEQPELDHRRRIEDIRVDPSRIEHAAPQRVAEVRDGRIIAVDERSPNYTPSVEANSIIIQTGHELVPYERTIKDIRTGELRKIEGMVLPERYICKMVEGGQAELSVNIETIEKLRYDENGRLYQGAFTITLLNRSQPASSQELAEAVMVELVSEAGDIFRPSPQFIIKHTNLPSTAVEVEDQSSLSPVPFIVKTMFNPEGYPSLLEKQAHLRIETESRELQGFGIESIPVNIVGITVDHETEISVTAEKGEIKPNAMILIPGKVATFRLRSGWPGTDQLKVSSAELGEVRRDFSYVFPWKFLLFAILGGLIGATIKRLMRRGRRNIAVALSLGALAGFLVAVLYLVVGIPIFSFEIEPNTHMIFVLAFAALGALFWEDIYEMLKKLVSKG